MYRNRTFKIDIERLRDDMRNECFGAYFVSGFGGALDESFDIDDATPDELVEMAQQRGINLKGYMV